MPTGGALIGALRVTLGLDSAEFEAGTKKARQAASRDAAAIQKALDGVKNRFDAMIGAIGLNELYEAGKRALDYASSLGEVAQQLGVSTKELQQFRYAASQVGLEQDEMDKSLAKLTRTIGEAKAGSKAQATVFRELGVAVQDANGRVLSAGELMPKLADAISKIKDPATRARVEVDLFGKAGQKLDTLLASGSAAVSQLTDEASRLGLVLSDEQIQKADETADKLAAIKQVLEARLASTVADNADAILTLANALGTLAAKSLEAVQNFSNFRNLRGFFLAGSTDAAKTLLSTASGRHDLRAETANRLAENNRKRNNPSNTPAMNAALDREFKALVNIQNRVNQADRQAQDRANQTPPPVAAGALPTVASSPTKKQHGPTAEETEEKHQQELSRIRQEQLQAELSLTTDAEKRADLQSQLLLEEFNERSAQIDSDKHFTTEQKKAQKALLAQLYGVGGDGDNIVVGGNSKSLAAGISREMQEQLAKEAYNKQSEELQAQQDALQGQLNLARTAEDRRRLELAILDLEYKMREAKLDQVINSQESSAAERQLAEFQKGKLAEMKAGDTANINRQNMGPLASYFDSVPQTASEVNEAFEKIAADGLANMNDQLATAAANTLKLKGVAGQLFNQLIADVIKLNIEAAAGGSGGILGGLLKLGVSALGGGSSLSSSLTTASSNVSSLAAGIDARNLAGLPGLATGGTIGGFPGVDNNVLSINGIPTARVSANERLTVHKNSSNDNSSGMQVQVIKGDLFDVIVRQQAASVAAPMAVASGAQARSAAGSDVARAQRRKIPGR